MAKTNSNGAAQLAVPTPEDINRLNAFWLAFADGGIAPPQSSPRDRMEVWAVEQRMIADQSANDRLARATWGLVLATVALVAATALQIVITLHK